MADEAKPLEDILSEGRAEKATDKPVGDVSKVTESPKAAQNRDEGGRFAPGQKAPEKPPAEQQQEQPPAQGQAQQPPQQPADPDSDPKNWTYAAYKDEKQKRQDAEQRIAAAEQRAKDIERQLQMMRAQQAQAQQKPQQPIDPIADPEGYTAELKRTQQEELKQIRLENNLQLAEMKHGEAFTKAWDAFLDAAHGGDKATYFRVMNSPNPGEAMVQWYREREAFSTIGPDPAKWQEEQRAKLREEILAEMNGGQPPQQSQQPSAQQQQAQMPSDLAGARNVGSRSGPAWPGAAPLGDIFARNPKRKSA